MGGGRGRGRGADGAASLIDDLLDAHGSLDALSELAHPVPLTAICALPGVPERDEPRIHAWSERLARSLDPMIALTGELDPGAPLRMRAGAELREYVRDLVRERWRDPAYDLLSGLIRASDGGRPDGMGGLIANGASRYWS